MKYDANIFTKFREKAVTDPNAIKVGSTYYTNFTNISFEVLDVVSERDFFIARNKAVGATIYSEAEIQAADCVIPRWVLVNKVDWAGRNTKDWLSLQDSNCGACYNPWLLFDNELDLINCNKELIIT